MFLHPLFLLGLATVAAPVVIHLVFKMRARQVPFPTIRFLKEIDRRVSRRKRLEELLVLFLRCAALLLLTLALTRPVSGGGLGASGTAAVIVLDDSYSMALKDADGTVFARARSLAGSVLRSLGPGDMAQVLTSRRRGDLARDIPALEAEVSKLEVSFGAGTLRPLVEAGLETLARTEAARRELYVVSDFQARASDLAGLDARGANVVLIPVRSSRRENLSITALELASPFATTATPARVRVAIANRGAAAVSRNLRLELDGKRVAEDLVFVPAGGRTTHVETVTLETPGLHVLEAALDEDALPADDRRLLALDVKQRARVLVIRPDAAGAASRSFYLERALDPGGTAQTGIEVVAVD
ncbi:MAG TPA: BatA domain-containing protein, partial [Planctomycetota bacterium]|nr:BatA domain-containing protein [Planctomycetota bacterium]